MGERSCPTDSELAVLLAGDAKDAPELFDHFDHCEACRETVAELGRHESELRLASGEVTTKPIEVAIGTAIGRYVVLGRLGAGAMGVVFMAYDPELDRKVALKLMRSKGGAAILAKEASTLARISDRRVVTAHDAGTFGELVFVVMELVDGVTLRRWLELEPRGERELVRVALEAGEGLVAAHRAGVVHRDFKPDNVMIDREGSAHVTDFGLALATDDREAARTVAGTLAYMAPEQLRGERADARSDQFAFAVTLWEALFGSRPFDGETRSELLAAITRSGPRAPKDKRAPKSVLAVLRRALEPEPERRFSSMEELLRELRPRARDRRPFVIAFGLALALGGAAVHRATTNEPAVCGGAHQKLAGVWDAPRRSALEGAFHKDSRAGFTTTSLTSTEAALDAYAASWESSWVSACEATEVRKEASSSQLDARMACLEDRKVALGALVDGLTHGDATALEHAVAAATALPSIDECLDPRRRVDEARDPASVALRTDLAHEKEQIDLGDVRGTLPALEASIATTRSREDHALLARELLLLGQARSLLSELPASRSALDEAAVFAERIDDPLLLAECYLALVHVVGNQLALAADGERYADHASGVIARLGSPFALEARRLLAVAELRRRASRFADGLAAAEGALAIYRAHDRLATLDAGAAWFAMAIASTSMGKHAEAEVQIHEALAVRERFLGADHPDVGRTLANLSTIESIQGKLEPSRVSGLRALAIFAGPKGDAVSSDVALAETNLGITEQMGGNLASARVHFARAVEVDRALLGDHPSTALSLANLGDADLEAGDRDRALAEYQEGIARLDRSGSADRRIRVALLLGLARANRDRAAALRTLDEVDTLLAAPDADPAVRKEAAAARATVTAR